MVWHDDGRLLLMERANTGLFDGRLTLPGGHVEAQETLTEAAVREVQEEVGIQVTETAPCGVLPFRGGVNFIFSTTRWQGHVSNLEPELCAAIDWYSADALPSNVVPWLPKALALFRSGEWFHDFRNT